MANSLYLIARGGIPVVENQIQYDSTHEGSADIT